MDDVDHRREAARIEQLLDDLQVMAAGPVWQRIEELVQRLVQVYGAGIERWCGHLREEGLLDEKLSARLAGDDLVASLLLLHGVHPWPVERRVELALERARPQLRAHVGEVVFLGVEGDVARMRVEGAGPALDLPGESLIHRALADAAPEIARVHLEGVVVREPRERPEPLLQIGLPRTRSPTETPG